MRSLTTVPSHRWHGISGRSKQTVLSKSHVVKAGLLDLLNPAKVSRKTSKASDVVDRLVELTESTDGGVKASAACRKEIAELVEELEQYCPPNPLRNPLLFGEYEVLYASKPSAAGGPLRSPLGRVAFPGQRLVQRLSPPNNCVNEVSYKALGFIPGSARQEGLMEPIDSKMFYLVFPQLDDKRAGGPLQRKIRTVYLDDRVRVARFISEVEDSEGSFFVFKRVLEDEDYGDDEVEKEEEEEVRPARNPLSSFGTQIFKRPTEGKATQVERLYYQRNKVAQRASPAPMRNKTNQEEVASARATAERERREAREAADNKRKLAREAAENEKERLRAAAEAQRVELSNRRQAAKSQLRELAEDAASASSQYREAQAELVATRRTGALLTRKATQARASIERAAADAQAANSLLLSSKQLEAEARAAVKSAIDQVRKIESALGKI